MKVRENIILPMGYKDIEDEAARDYLKAFLLAFQTAYRDISTAINGNDNMLLKGAAANRPAAAANVRGRIYITEGAAGAADSVDICLKSAADTYSWKNITTG